MKFRLSNNGGYMLSGFAFTAQKPTESGQYSEWSCWALLPPVRMRSDGRVVGSVCLCVCYSTSHFSNVCSSHKRYDRPMKVRSFEPFYLKIKDIRIFRFPFPISHFSFPVLRSRFAFLVPRFSPLVSSFTFSLRVSRNISFLTAGSNSDTGICN